MFERFRTVVAVALLTTVAGATAVEVAKNHPDTYVVRKGDTLWDIAGKFLKKPWLWPEIWQANPQVANPHLIYPGDVLSLAYLDRTGAPVVRPTPGPRQEAPIDAIPLAEVEPFLKDLRIVDEFQSLPYVAGIEDNQLRGSGGNLVYVKGLGDATTGQRYEVLRPTLRYGGPHGNQDLDFRGKELYAVGSYWKDYAATFKSREFLGYELARVSVGTLTRAGANGTAVGTLLLEDNGHEVRPGDRVVPVTANPYDLQFFPHPPKATPEAGKLRVLAVADTYSSAGPRDVIAISGGSRDGLDNGTVLSVWRMGSGVIDRLKHPGTSQVNDAATASQGAGRTRLPDEYAAHVMIFRTFDKVSYGLVMAGVKPVMVGYELKHPDAQ